MGGLAVRSSLRARAGYVDHYQTGADDMGWGCGWRNIMMICSNLVRRQARGPAACRLHVLHPLEGSWRLWS